MSADAPAALTPEERAIVEEEESILARVLASLRAAAARGRARSSATDLRSVQALRQLNEEAMAASEDDLPALLLEMGVRRRLLDAGPGAELPDPRVPYVARLVVREGGARKDYLLGRASYF